MIKKPLSYEIYDYTEGGIDIPDERMGSYTTKYKTRKWTLVALSNVLDIARIKSQAIYVINNAKEDIDSIEWELMKALVKLNMHTCLASGGLLKHLQNPITHILAVEHDKVEQPPPNDDTPRRCKRCVIASHGKGHKSIDSMSKVKSRCAKCQQHTITVCQSCT